MTDVSVFVLVHSIFYCAFRAQRVKLVKIFSGEGNIWITVSTNKGSVTNRIKKRNKKKIKKVCQ